MPASPAGTGLPLSGDVVVWDCLAGCLRDTSDLGAHIGAGWLLRLLVAAAERELMLGSTATPSSGAGDSSGSGGARVPAAATLPPALLPEVYEGAGCYLAPGARGLEGQDRLRELLTRVLATTPDARAPEAFISAVGALLAHVRLRCRLAALEAADEMLGQPETPASVRRALAADADGGGSGGGGNGGPRGLGGPGESPEGVTERQDSQDTQHSGADSAGSWHSLDVAGVVISTISLAVEWLLQAPEVARQGAMLQATEVLLSFLASPPGGVTTPGAGGSGLAKWRRCAAGAGEDAAGSRQSSPERGPPQQQQQQQQAPLTPAQAIAAVAATPPSRRSTAHHKPATHGSTAGPAGSPLPASPLPVVAMSVSSTAASPLGPLGPVAAQQQRPVTPAVGSLDTAGVAASAVCPEEGPDADAAAAAARALAAAEDQGTLLWSFLQGIAVVPSRLLRRVPPLLLQRLFEELKPDTG